jgi:selenocysteine lyase/cysteine desulfurase
MNIDGIRSRFPPRSTISLWTRCVLKARTEAARLIHADETEVALVESTSHGLNIIGITGEFWVPVRLRHRYQVLAVGERHGIFTYSRAARIHRLAMARRCGIQLDMEQ